MNPKQSSTSETRINALRFTQPTTVPVKQGSTVELIPVHIIPGIPLVLNIDLLLGDYIHLTQDAQVQSAFYCLLLLAQ